METAPPIAGQPRPITEEEFELFRVLIYRETGIALKPSKRTLVMSRLTKRLQQHSLANYSEYYQWLSKKDPQRTELRHMINCITTNKTSFFREEEHFTILRRFLAAAGDRTIRIWSAACSTGEEPYSIAITACEAAAARVQIFGSDIDTDVLARAEAGNYAAESIAGLAPEMRRRYFLRGTGCYAGLVQAKPRLRQMVSFGRINFVDPAWSVESEPPFDVIFCRNVMIYFDRATQNRLLQRLAARLDPRGLLFTGHSESLFWLTESLAPVGHSVYRRRTGEPS
jgi:chemotaxis protein methyltransferase CheR